MQEDRADFPGWQIFQLGSLSDLGQQSFGTRCSCTLQSGSQNTQSFLRLPSNVDAPHACRHHSRMQATCIPQILLCPPKLRGSHPNVLAVWEKGGQWTEAVPRLGGLSTGCSFGAGEVHRALLGGREGRGMQARLPHGDV